MSYDWREIKLHLRPTSHTWKCKSWRGLERVTPLLRSLLLPPVQGESRQCPQARCLTCMWLELVEVNPIHLHPGKSPVMALAQSSISRMKPP